MKTVLKTSVPPFATTFMGMLHGAAAALDIHVSDPMLYGLSGHCFVVHVHSQLCPSGPYCWDRTPLYRLTRSFGLQINDLGFFSLASDAETRADVEVTVLRELEAGRPAGLVNLEFQLITGSDQSGFQLSQPWPDSDFPPRHLSFGSWKELGDSVHINFFTFARCECLDIRQAMKRSLEFAASLHENPRRWAGLGYGMGPDAFTYWLEALAAHGGSHGHWWNSQVWSDCSRRAAEFITSIGSQTELEEAEPLAAKFARIADLISEAGDRQMGFVEKSKLLKEAQALHASTYTDIKNLTSLI